MSFVFMCVGITVVMMMEMMPIFMPAISSSVFSAQFGPDSQSAIYNSGPGLYIMYILYWWICRRMHLSCWERVDTSFLNIMTVGWCSVITFTSFTKQYC